MFRRVEGWSLLSATDSPQQKLLLKELLRIDCLTLSDVCLSFLFVNQRRLVSDVKKGSFSKNRQYIIEKWRVPSVYTMFLNIQNRVLRLKLITNLLQMPLTQSTELCLHTKWPSNGNRNAMLGFNERTNLTLKWQPIIAIIASYWLHNKPVQITTHPRFSVLT